MTDCFACEGPIDLALDRPGNWLGARYACSEHAHEAVLPTGEMLTSFLGRRQPADYPLEGSGLNWVINPARVGNYRAWLDFHFAWPVVAEEIFESASYFDFLVQHAPQHVTVLHLLWEDTRQHESASPETRLLRILAHNPSQAGACSTLWGLWAHQLAIDAEFAKAADTFVATPERAQALARAGFARVEPTLGHLVQKLMHLAFTRFAHLR